MNSNIKNDIDNIYSLIKKSADKIIKYMESKGQRFKDGLFNDVKVVDYTNYQNIEDCKGIYVLQMEEDFICELNFDLAEKSSKRRDTNITKFEKNKILYLGKSYNVKNRAKNHFLGTPASTYSLKMSDEKRKNQNGRPLNEFVKMYIFCLKSDYANDAKYYEILLPAIEDILHDKLQPIIGTPRK